VILLVFGRIFFLQVSLESKRERAATTAAIEDEHEFIVEIVAGALPEIREEIIDENKQAIETMIAGVRKDLDTLQQDISKRAAAPGDHPAAELSTARMLTANIAYRRS
jgi:hypothetical protein